MLPAFLIHPTSPHYDEKTVDEMLGKILRAKRTFERSSLLDFAAYLNGFAPAYKEKVLQTLNVSQDRLARYLEENGDTLEGV